MTAVQRSTAAQASPLSRPVAMPTPAIAAQTVDAAPTDPFTATDRASGTRDRAPRMASVVTTEDAAMRTMRVGTSPRASGTSSRRVRAWPPAPRCELPPPRIGSRRLCEAPLGKVPTNGDLAFVLAVSEITMGMTVNHVVTRYRTWDGQTVTDPDYVATKRVAFATIAALHSARRAAVGRPPIVAPVIAGGAHGRVAR